jgi:Smr domain
MILIKTVNLKFDRPSVHEALERLDREIGRARQQNLRVLKIIHGYGSTGAGGDIRIAVQKRLREMVDAGQIAVCIFGEEWSKSSEQVWRMLEAHPELKPDPDLGRRNLGITIVVL